MLDLAVRRQQGAFLVDFSLSAGPGVTALFGQSGSGKTSVIGMVAGLSRPDRGHIHVDGRVLFDSLRKIDLAPEKRRLGYVFQEGRLFPHLSVLSNLEYGMRRVPAAERTVRMDDVVEVLGIGALLDRRPAKLSGGEKQRVAIGRALLASPRILLMDEPLASLDSHRKDEVLPFIARLAREFAIPILYVSHSMDEVLRLADTLVLIENGRSVAAGPVEEVLARRSLYSLTGRNDAGAVVTARVERHDESLGVTHLSFAGGALVAVRLDQEVGTLVRIRVHAADITLVLEPPVNASVRNVVPALIRDVGQPDNHVIDVRLDCNGAALWAQITEHAQAELRLVPGQRVYALVKAVTIAQSDIAARLSVAGGA